MMSNEITTEELDLHPKAALKASQEAPVFVTEGGKPAFVLISQAHYQQLIIKPGSIVDALSLPPTSPDAKFNAPKANIVAKPIDTK